MQDRRRGAREETKKKKSRRYRSRNKLEERPGGQKGKEERKTSEVTFARPRLAVKQHDADLRGRDSP